jgi:glycosyltransferase involved in cell wall biosynthesis
MNQPMVAENGLSPEILFVVGTLRLGGAERHIAVLTQALVRLGWRVTVYVLYEDGPLHDVMRDAGVRIIFPPVAPPQPSWSKAERLLRQARVALDLFAVMRRRRPMIAHMVLPSPYLIGGPVAFAARVPVRVMSRLSLNVYQADDWRYRLVERWLHRRMTAVLANAMALVRELHEQEGVPSERLGLLYLGIDASQGPDQGLRGRKRAELGLKPAAVILTIVANLIPYKGHADLIDALAQAAPRLNQDWSVLVVGRDEGIGEELRERAVERGIEGHLLFLGQRQDVRDILNASDIGVLCSHQEGFSVALLESMSAGLPMIVTAVGGNAEAVLDGETGTVVPAHQPTALADAIVRLVDDQALRARYGQAARQRILDRFTIEHCAAAYDRLYRTLLAGGRPWDVPQIRASL